MHLWSKVSVRQLLLKKTLCVGQANEETSMFIVSRCRIVKVNRAQDVYTVVVSQSTTVYSIVWFNVDLNQMRQRPYLTYVTNIGSTNVANGRSMDVHVRPMHSHGCLAPSAAPILRPGPLIQSRAHVFVFRLQPDPWNCPERPECPECPAFPAFPA